MPTPLDLGQQGKKSVNLLDYATKAKAKPAYDFTPDPLPSGGGSPAPAGTDAVSRASAMADNLLAEEPSRFDRFKGWSVAKGKAASQAMFGQGSTLNKIWQSNKGGVEALFGDELTAGEKAKAAAKAPFEMLIGMGEGVIDFGKITIPRMTATTIKLGADAINKDGTIYPVKFFNSLTPAGMAANQVDNLFGNDDPIKIERELSGFEKWRNAKAEKVSETMQTMLNGLDIIQQERMQELGITPGQSDVSPAKFGYGLSQGVSSIAAYAGITYLTKNPVVGSAFLGWVEGSETYNQSLNQLKLDNPEMTDDEAEAKARSLAVLNAGGIAVLERIGMGALFHNYAGGVMRNAAIGAITETTQEVTQTIWSNGVEKYGYNETKGLYDDVAKTIILTFPVGLGGGMFSSDTLSGQQQQEVINDIKSSEAFPIDQAIEAGDIAPEAVYSDVENRILQPNFAEGRIQDVYQKIAAVDEAAANKFLESVDQNNTTYNDILAKGIEVVHGIETDNVDPTQVTFEGANPRDEIFKEVAPKYPQFTPGEIQEVIDASIDSAEGVAREISRDDFTQNLQEGATRFQEDITDAVARRGLEAVVDDIVADQAIPVSDRAAATEIVQAAVAAGNANTNIQQSVQQVADQVRLDTSKIEAELQDQNQREDELRRADQIREQEAVKATLSKNKELSAIIKDAEQNEANALATIESAVRNVVGTSADGNRIAALSAEVLDTIRDARYAPVIAELNLNEVIRQVDRANPNFQLVANATRRPTGRAKFDNIHEEDMRAILAYNDTVRRGEEASPKLETAVRRLAERYGLNTETTPKRLANSLDLRIMKSQKATELAERITTEFEQQQAEQKARDKKKAEAKARKAKKPAQEQVDQIKNIPLLREVPVQMVEKIASPDGREAFGMFYRNIVSFVEDADVTTIPHEAFHVFSQLALNDRERAAMYNEARKAYDRPLASDFDIEETLAQDFAEWYVDQNAPKTFTEKLVEFFNKLKAFLDELVTGETRDTLEGIFNDVMSRQAAERVRYALRYTMNAEDFRTLREAYYQNPEGFTLRLFDHEIFQKPNIGKQEVMQAVKQMGLKQGEAKLHEAVLARPEFSEVKKFDSQQYRRTVLGEMIQLRVVDSSTYATYGMDNIERYSSGEHETAKTYIIDTNYKHGRSGHFGNETEGLHSHFRAFVDRDESAFKVLEIQSDVYQRGVKANTEAELIAEMSDHLERMDYNLRQHLEKIQTISEEPKKVSLGKARFSVPDFRSLRDTARVLTREYDIARPAKLDINEEDIFHIDASGDVESYVRNTKKDVAARAEMKDILSKYVDETIKVVEKMRVDINNGVLSDEMRKEIELSKQFASMKNVWYEQNIRTAIRKAAEQGTLYFDMADSRTVAAIEGYIGEGGQLTEARGANASDVQPRDAEVGDYVGYLDSYDALVVETMHDDNSLGIVYSTSEEDINTATEADLAQDARDQYEENSEFDDRFGWDALERINEQLTHEQRIEVAKAALNNKSAYGNIPSAQIDRDLAALQEMNEDDAKENFVSYIGTGIDISLTFDSTSGEIRSQFEDIKFDILDEYQENYDAEEYFTDVYGSNAIYRYYDKKYDQWNIAWVSDGTLDYVEASYGGNSEDFSLDDMNEDQAGISAKYGDNKGWNNDYFKYLKKIRPDLEQVEDENGFTWWRTAITESDRADVPLFQLKDEDQESSRFTDLQNKMEEIISQVEGAFAMSEAGYTFEDGVVAGRYTSFPNWIPKPLRDRRLMDRTLTKLLDNKPIRGSREVELAGIIQEYVVSNLPTELADEVVLNEYFSEQMKVADSLRAETLKGIQRLVTELDERMKDAATIKKADAKKIIRYNTNQVRPEVREFSRKMKQRAVYFNRGYRSGYKQGAKDKLYAMLTAQRSRRQRKNKIERLKSYYRRVKQATRTGSTLPLEYQQRLLEVFEAFDLTSMTPKTKASLSRMKEYFESQEGDAPKEVAKRIARLEKIPVGKLGDEAIEQILNEVTRIFENGVTKKRLMDTRDEKQFASLVERVVGDTSDFSEVDMSSTIRQGSLKLYDPTRFADIMDGSDKSYSGGNFTELVQPVRESIDRANLRTDSILAEAFEEIKDFAETFTDEEMARMTVALAREQGADGHADATTERYKTKEGWDFVSPLTEKERGAMDVMRRYFKEIYPSVAGTYEAINNTPFPDIENYFPLKTDKKEERFDIDDKDQAFDFKMTKTSQGFTVERQPGAGRILDIYVFRTFSDQISKQVYYSEVQPTIDRTRQVVNTPQYQSKLNQETQNYWRQFIEDVVSRGMGKSRFLGQGVLDTARVNISTAILGYKASTILIQPSAVFDSMVALRQELGWGAVAEVIPRFMKMMFSPAAVQSAIETSAALANRQGGVLEIQEMKNATSGIFADSPWRRGWHTFKANAYAGIRFTDMRTAASVFDTLYKGYLKKGYSSEAATRRAEQMMMLSQSSANVAARPQILNNSVTKAVLPFQSFVLNAFNNIRYDSIQRELKTRGNVTGTVMAVSNMQFLVYAVAYEAYLYAALGSLLGYDDDEPFWKRMLASGIGRIPGAGFFIAFDGSFHQNGIDANNPIIDSVQAAYKVLMDAVSTEQEVSRKEFYKGIRGVATLLGLPGTQQINQLLTAPSLFGLDLGLAWDQRTIAEKRADEVLPYLATNPTEVTETDVDAMLKKIYGKDWEERTVKGQVEAREALYEEIAFRQTFGAEDPIVAAEMGKKNNDEVIAAFVQQFGFDGMREAINRYDNTVKTTDGRKVTLISSQLEKELKEIAKAPTEWQPKIERLLNPDLTDQERVDIVDGDLSFAKKAASDYGLISKELYESLTK